MLDQARYISTLRIKDIIWRYPFQETSQVPNADVSFRAIVPITVEVMSSKKEFWEVVIII